MKIIRRIVAFFAVIALVVGVTACGTSSSASTGKNDLTRKITFVSGTPGWPQSMGFIASDLGLWKKAGLTGLTFKPLNSGTAAGEAIGSGHADAGYTNTATALALIAKGAPVVIISGTAQGGDGVVVWGNSTITSVSQLRGKKVAVPQGNTTHELMFRLHVLPSAGLSYSDITRVPLSPQDMTEALQTGQVAAAVMFDPYMGTAIQAGAKILVPPNKMWNGAAYSSVLLVRKSLIQQDPGLVQKLADVHAQVIKYIKDNPDKAAKILVSYSHQNLQAAVQSEKHIIFKAEADAQSLQKFVNGMKKVGLIQNAPSVSKAVDPSFINKAVKSVG